MTPEKGFGELLIEGLAEAIAFERGELPARTHFVEAPDREHSAVGKRSPRPRRSGDGHGEASAAREPRAE